MGIHRSSCVAVSLVCVALAGCQGHAEGGGGTTEATASAVAPLASASAGPTASAARPRSRMSRHGGLAAALFHGAREAPDLTAAQQESLDAIEASLKTDDDGVRSAMKELRADLAAGAKAGKLDTAKLTADDGLVDKAAAEHQAKESAALDSLHGLLSATQRAALVNRVKARQAEREGHMTGWLKAKEADGGAVDWNKKHLDKLTTDLGLDAGQQKQVAAILGKNGGAPDGAALEARVDDRKKRSDALLAAFAGDTFDAKALDLGVVPGKTPHEAVDHVTAFVAHLLPILRPDQRDKLAAGLDRPFGAGGGRPPTPGSPPSRGPIDDMLFPFTEPTEGPPEGDGPGREVPPPPVPPSTATH